ncbi:hypothetical protein BDN70DRAFT_937997 [Pholiota conissans]|uniref:F-box domain-containing protein n=1 Tax=Pholiota conissans TaxID=109636 RepID=A0A9P6CT46_9AGAR|nr:hypothetical protein BDN70DRAFT_937997 [Pholiota conissans]
MPSPLSPPLLPVELKWSIIDHVRAFSDNDTLATLALVCRAFRRRVNYHRFRTVKIRDINDIRPTYRLLTNDCIWSSPHERLNAHVNLFEVKMLNSKKYFKRRCVLTSNSSKLEFIFHNIFQTYSSDIDQSSNVSLSFTWDVRIWNPRSDEKDRLDWTNLGLGLQSAFRTMLRHPHLDRLKICALENVPRDLIRESPINNLQFSEVGFSRDLGAFQHEGILSGWHLQHLTRLVIDHSTPFVELIGLDVYGAESPTIVFPRLQALTSCVCDEMQYEMTVAVMQRARNVQHLSLAVLEPGKLPKEFPYTQLQKLETLCLVSGGTLRPFAQNYQRTVRDIITPLLPSIPPIRHLEIHIAIASTSSLVLENEAIFKGHDFSALDNFLGKSSPPSLETLKVRLTIEVFGSSNWWKMKDFLEREGGEYVQSVCFPKLAKMMSPVLMVGIDVDLDFDIPEEYFSNDLIYEWNNELSLNATVG